MPFPDDKDTITRKDLEKANEFLKQWCKYPTQGFVFNKMSYPAFKVLSMKKIKLPTMMTQFHCIAVFWSPKKSLKISMIRE